MFFPVQAGDTTPTILTMAMIVPECPIVVNVSGYDAIRIGFLGAADGTDPRPAC